jgi:hypothetical protein
MLKVKLLDNVARKGKLKVRVETARFPVRVLLREPRQLFRDGFHRLAHSSARVRRAASQRRVEPYARHALAADARAPLRRLKGR